MDSEPCLLLGVRELCLLSWVGMVGVGLDMEPCLLRDDFLVPCSGMAGKEVGLKKVGAEPPPEFTSAGLKKVKGASACSVVC